MKKYTITVNCGLVGYGYTFESTSRNAKNHCRNTSAEYCTVEHNGKTVSKARRWWNNKITNIIF